MSRSIEKPVIVGDWQNLFDPNPGRTEHAGMWYTNDHCFCQGNDGTWHGFGIIGYRPPDCWKVEQQLFHISGPDLLRGPWKEHDYALVSDPGREQYLWAPNVFAKGGEYFMMYAGGVREPGASDRFAYGTMHQATSRDLFTWKRNALNPLFTDPGNARDPFIAEWEGRFYCYFTRTLSEIDHRSCVFVRESPDLLHWGGPRLVYMHDTSSHWAGDTESPMVIRRGDLYYLFICVAYASYYLTRVFWSNNPLSFDPANKVTDLEAHAPEIIELPGDRWIISKTGWFQNGIYTAALEWK